MAKTPAETPMHSRKPWAFDDGVPIIDGRCLRGCEIATDSASAAPAPQIQVLTLPAWVDVQPSAAKLKEADYIAGLYAGVPFATGEKRHREYLERKAERSLR